MSSGPWRSGLLLGGLPLMLFAALSATAGVSVENLRSEYRVNPLGVDVLLPRLSWVLRSERRGEKQTGYRVLVASSEERLRQDSGDLWDSGKIESGETVHVEYAGVPLRSRMHCHWKVRVWDRDGQPSPWSDPGFWTMGLLASADWVARWVELPVARMETPHNGFHGPIVNSADRPQWVVLDLGQAQRLDSIRLWPARPYDWSPDTPGFLFPVRFKVEAAQKEDFSDARSLVDCTDKDQANPGDAARQYRFEPVTARYVRLTVTRLARRDGENFGFALAEMEALAGEKNLAQGAKVSVSGSIEAGGWSTANLVDGRTKTVAPQALRSLAAPMLRTSFTVDGPVQRATAYVTGLGLYEMHLNGRRVGEQLLAPEWTNYRKRIQYQVYDVTSLLRAGENAVGALLGEGWHAGRLMSFGRHAYGSAPQFLMQLEIRRADGTMQTVVTDESWRGFSGGPVLSSGIYDGEVYDARREPQGWDAPGFDAAAWSPVKTSAPGSAALVWQRNEPIHVVQELKAVAMSEPKPGVYVFDLGQNMVGWCRVTVRGPAGTTVTLRHAEMLNDDGTVYTANLRGAPQVDRFTLRGGVEEVFEPHFTYHGFRYVELTGLPERPAPDAVRGRVFRSSAPETGSFQCSSDLLNRLMRNILWTQRGNLMSSPTDCPQRDERFGWMGDIQAFAQTAIFNMDLAAFFSKWVRDIRDDQAADGRYPDFAPHAGDPNRTFSGVPAWGDAGVIVPWRAYVNYADVRMLREHFESARRWVDWIRAANPDLIWVNARHNNYNDWLNGDTLKMKDWPSKGGAVPPDVFATAFFAHSTDLVARMAAVLGLRDEAARYGKLFEQIKEAFNRRFVKADGGLEGETQAGYALALHFDLLPEELRPKAAARMVEGFKRYKGHLSTGIQSSHRLMLELTRNGWHEEACRLAGLRDFPSWGLMIENGATTIWERWDGYVKGRGFQDQGMNSFNHWALGAVGEWVLGTLAGINPDETHPGFRHFVIRPRPGGDVTWARGEYLSIRGRIASDWKREGGRFVLNVTVPPNTTATVYVPADDAGGVRESGRPAAQAEGVRFLRMDGGAAVYEIESGSYRLESAVPERQGEGR